MLATVIILLVAAGLGPVLARRVPRRSGVALAILPAALFAFFVRQVPTVAGGQIWQERRPWVSGLGVELAFRLDGLGLLFALLVSGIGALVVVYAGTYFKGDARLPRFYAVLFLFMAAMLGLVLADDGILLFVFWELTSVSSYLLIGFNHEDEEARESARQALFVTGAGGLAMLAGLLLVQQVTGTLRLSAWQDQAALIQGHGLYVPILLLLLAGAFTKSAQVPFHFWLPGAMAAPGPVSAYLHSATMVKAGIYLLARLNPVLGGTVEWHYLVMLAGGATLVTGAAMAYAQTDLKRLLAYTTVSGLGTLTLLLGIGTELAAQAAMVFLLVHALYKAALFLGVGTVDHEAQTRDLRKLSGLAHVMPLTAVAITISAASMAGMPPLFGFLAKELFYEAKKEAPRAGEWLTILSFVGSAFVAAAAGLVAWRPFFRRLGQPSPPSAHEGPPALWLGPVVLAAISTLLSLFPERMAIPLVQPAAAAVHGEHTELVLRRWAGMSPTLLQSLAMLLLGVGLYHAHDRVLRWAIPARRLAGWGPARAYRALLVAFVAVASWQTRLLQNGVLGRYTLVVIATAVGLGTWALLRTGNPVVWPTDAPRAYEAMAMLAILAGAMAVVRARSILFAITALGIVGYGIALVFLLFGGPDLALTQFAVESLAVILFVLILRRLPRLRALSSASERLRDGVVAVAGGVLMSAIVLAVLSARHPTPLRDFYAAASVPLANGRNVVNVILVDFRALDTLGEVTVLVVAALGVLALLRLRPTPSERP